MSVNQLLTTHQTEHGMRVAVVFALVAEYLNACYEHQVRLTQAQMASLCAEWLARSKRTLPLQERKQLALLADQMARQIEQSVSREVGLHIAYEMNEALDPRYESPIGVSMMAECERMLDAAQDIH